MMNPFDTNRLQRIYDDFAPSYDRGRDGFDNSEQLRWLSSQLTEAADVLDAGCGSGHPVLRFFADRGHRVTGSDICSSMLNLAAEHVPEAQLVQADSAELRLPDESFDLIISFYSLFHLSVEAQERAFDGFFRMLKPGGLAYFTLASEEYTGQPVFSGTKRFAGVELPYSHVTPEDYREILEKTGYSPVEMEHLSIGGETMLWVYCVK